MSPGEAAATLGVTRQLVYKLIGEGRVRRYHIGTRALIPVSDVLALIEDGPDAPAA